MKKRSRSIAVLICIVIIILDGETAIQGIRQGIEICQKTVIPALFPFLVLCGMLTGDLPSSEPKYLQKLYRRFHIPSGAGPILLTGLVGGYPAGARSVDQAFSAGQLSKKQAERLLPLCNQCGPAFLFGMLRSVFDPLWVCWSLWAIQLISVICTAQLFPPCEKDVPQLHVPRGISLTSAMKTATRSIAEICAWVTAFRMCICFLERWILWLFPLPFRTGIIGALELSNGCLGLQLIENGYLRFILCSGMLSFGGLCVTMQTFSVISEDLEKKHYLKGKLLQCIISVALSISFCLLNTRPLLALIPLLIISTTVLLKKVDIRSRFSRKIHV